ncbi:MAG: hypothetical protein CL946_09175 [Ectothiorhodospiraceae bacterium]|nr:hypothetical protein [Ectothiorhodospiraceae bacterium]
MTRPGARYALFCILVCGIVGTHHVTAQTIHRPLLTITPPRAEFDTTFCGTTKCMNVTFRNDGDTALTVHSFEAIQSPFSGAVTTPLVLAPGETSQVSMCYSPSSAPRADSQLVSYVADVRTSASIGLLIDVTSSMNEELEAGLTRMAALQNSGTAFFQNLVDTTGIRDEAAVFSFQAASEFRLVRDFTSNPGSLITAIPDSGNGAESCIYDALNKTINNMNNRLNQRILIIVTDGSDDGTGVCGPLSRAGVIMQANSEDVRIFSIGIGDADTSSLRILSEGTGGSTFYAQSQDELNQALMEILNRLATQVEQTFVLRGRSVSPVLEVDPASIDFFTVELGSSNCEDITLRNTGDAPLEILDVSGIAAPFSIQGATPGTIMPGGQATLTVCFSPTVSGFHSVLATIEGNGCNAQPIEVQLRGVGFTNAAEARGPILIIGPNPLVFDTTFCSTSKCRDVSFTNIGDTVLTVSSIDPVTDPFSSNFTTPFQLQPNESRSFELCYAPLMAPGFDSQDISIIADTRVPLSVGLLFDVSGSMEFNETSDGVPLIDAARNAGLDFISGLLDLPEIQDEAAVFTFETAANFATEQAFTANKALLNAAVPSTATGNATCIYDALVKTINAMSARQNRRVLIILSDGEDSGTGTCGGTTPQNAIDAATTNDVAIYTIGLGTADPTILTNIANQTGGEFYTANTASDLVAVYRAIATSLSQDVELEFSMEGESVTPTIQITPLNVEFDSIRVGNDDCMFLEIENGGNAELDIESITRLSIGGTDIDQFTITNPPQAPIQPGESIAVQVCFAPTRLRMQEIELEVVHNDCNQGPITVEASGIGWDSVTVVLVGEYAARPGNRVTIPVILQDEIPAEYEVTQISLTIDYNKTLLNPINQPILTSNNISEVFPTLNHSNTYGLDFAETEFTLSGGTLVNTAPNSELFGIAFLALHGNAMQTPVQLIDAQFEDGNPRVGIVSPATFSSDSLCFQEERLIDASARYTRSLILSTSPNPFGEFVRIHYSIVRDSDVRITVHNTLGDVLHRHERSGVPPGEYMLTYTPEDLRPGIYFIRLEAGGDIDTHSTVHVK